MLYSQGQNNDDFNNDNDTTVLFDFLTEEEAVQDSKGLPQYFISDVMGEDVVCPFGLEEKNCYYMMTSCAGMKAYSSAP